MKEKNINTNSRVSYVPAVVDGVYYVETIITTNGVLAVPSTRPPEPGTEPYIGFNDPMTPHHAFQLWTIQYNLNLLKYEIISSIPTFDDRFYVLKAYEDLEMQPTEGESKIRIRLVEPDPDPEDSSPYWNIAQITNDTFYIQSAKYPSLLMSANDNNEVFLIATTEKSENIQWRFKSKE